MTMERRGRAVFSKYVEEQAPYRKGEEGQKNAQEKIVLGSIFDDRKRTRILIAGGPNDEDRRNIFRPVGRWSNLRQKNNGPEDHTRSLIESGIAFGLAALWGFIVQTFGEMNIFGRLGRGFMTGFSLGRLMRSAMQQPPAHPDSFMGVLRGYKITGFFLFFPAFLFSVDGGYAWARMISLSLGVVAGLVVPNGIIYKK